MRTDDDGAGGLPVVLVQVDEVDVGEPQHDLELDRRSVLELINEQQVDGDHLVGAAGGEAVRAGEPVLELLYNDDVPDGVAVSEAVALAKTLSTDESPSFINGLLGRLQQLKPSLLATFFNIGSARVTTAAVAVTPATMLAKATSNDRPPPRTVSWTRWMVSPTARMIRPLPRSRKMVFGWGNIRSPVGRESAVVPAQDNRRYKRSLITCSRGRSLINE